MTTEIKTIERIIQVWVDWDPIEVGVELAGDEYNSYIPHILKFSQSKEQLMKCLENIVNEMEVGFNPKDKKHTADLQAICNKFIQAVQGTEILR